ncbi:MAG: hypothetical protein Q9187_006656, partial [Circinaria calcarea]
MDKVAQGIEEIKNVLKIATSENVDSCFAILQIKQVRSFGNTPIGPSEDPTADNKADKLEGESIGAGNLELLTNDANELPEPPITGDSLPSVLNQLLATTRECPSTLTSNADLVGYIAANGMHGNEDSQEWPKNPVKQEVVEIIRRRSSPVEHTSELQPFIKRSPSTPPPDANDTLPADNKVRELEQTGDSEIISARGTGQVDLFQGSSSLRLRAPNSDKSHRRVKEKSTRATSRDMFENPPSDLGTMNIQGLQVLEPQTSEGIAPYMTKDTSSPTRLNCGRPEPEEAQQHIRDLGTNVTAQDDDESHFQRESIIPFGAIAAGLGTPDVGPMTASRVEITNANASLLQPREEVLDSQSSRVRDGRSLMDYAAQIAFSSEIGNEDPLAMVDSTVNNSGVAGDVHTENTSTATGTLAPLPATKGKQAIHSRPRTRPGDTTTGEDTEDEFPSRPAKRAKTSSRASVEKKQPSDVPLSKISSIQETPRKRYNVNVSAATTPTNIPNDRDSVGTSVEVRVLRSLRKPREVQPLPGSDQQSSRPESGGIPVSSGSSIRTRKSADPGSSLGSPRGNGSLKILYASSTNVDNLRSVMKVLAKHGVRQVQKVADCDYLCVGHGKELKKTGRFILAVAMGKYVISDEWAKKSAEQGRLLDPRDYLAKDPAREKEWGTGLTEACERGQKNAKPLLGRKILFTPFVSKDLGKGFGELKDIAK